MIRFAVMAFVLVVQPELIERTLALVGGQPITLSDARAAVAFGEREPKRPTERHGSGWGVGAKP